VAFVRTVRTRVRVRYAETDQMGVVYHSNYFPWMEMGRVELCRANGIRYRDLEANDGILLAVAEVACRFHHPARYDDEVDIDAFIIKAHPRMVTFGYRMTHAETGRKLATGETRHVFVGRDMKPCKLPPKYFEVFGIDPRQE